MTTFIQWIPCNNDRLIIRRETFLNFWIYMHYMRTLFITI